MFFQIHMLQSVPPGNLNRDESGQPKKCLFGGVTRGRISSQCLKRTMRSSSFFEAAFGESMATRTRLFPSLVSDAFSDRYGADAEEAVGVKVALKKLFGGKEKAKGQDDDDESTSTPKEQDDAAKTSQVVFFPMIFVETVAELLSDARKKEPEAWKVFVGKKKKPSADEKKKAEKAIQPFIDAARQTKESTTVDIALFGRMTTSDLIANVEASCQVAHAISTHEALIESDYFTAVDELDRSGAGFVSDAEARTFFNAAVYYKYLNVDGRAFLKTLGAQGERHAHKVPSVLLQAAALAAPTGKQNSFAAHSAPELILVEVSRVRQPITYANAFLKPVQGEDLMRESVVALSDYCGSVARAFAPQDTQRFVLAVGRAASVPFSLDAHKVETLADLVARVDSAWKPDLPPV